MFEYDLEEPDDYGYTYLKKQISTDFAGFDKTNPDFDKLIDKGLLQLFTHYKLIEDPLFYSPVPPLGVEGALRILDDQHMRRLITAMSLCDIQDTDIDLIVNARYNYNYQAEDAQMFVRYFADFKDYKFKDRELYVDHITDKDSKRVFKLALTGDKNMLLWNLGLAPDKSFDSMLRDIATDSFYFFKERMKNHLEDDAQKWAMLFLKTQERIDKLDADNDDKKTLFGEVQFQIQASKSATAIVPAETVMLDLPMELSQSRGEILSAEQLQHLAETTTYAIEEPREESNQTDEK